MPTRSITFNVANGLAADLAAELHNFSSDALSIRLTTNAVPVTTATNSALSEVTGANYTSGGIACSQTLSSSGGSVTVQSSEDFLWSANGSGFTNAHSAVIYNDTSSRIIAVADIRDGSTVVDSSSQDVDINLENGTDLFTIGA